jgi:hypothetical protein
MKKNLLLSLLLLVAVKVGAQVALAPTAIILDKNGIGTLYITNNSAVPQEISVGFQFGYTTENESGNLYIKYDDSVRLKSHHLEGIKAFPKNFILPPKQQQIVRIQVRMPKDKPDGMYFCRVKVGSANQVADVDQSTGQEGVSTRINVRFEQVIAAFMKKGDVTTGVKIGNIESKVENQILALTLPYETTGNAPFLGRVTTKLKAADGKEVVNHTGTIVMYFNGRRNLSFALPEGTAPGRYQLEMTFETERSDITPVDLVKAPPFTHRATITIP